MSVSVQFGTTDDMPNVINKTCTLGTAVTCELKDGTSVESPVFLVTSGAVSKTDTYAHCSDLGRYYYINDITLSPDGCYVSCTCDPLKSFATQILAKQYNVVRGEHRDINSPSGMLVDQELNRLSQMDVQTIAASSGIAIVPAGNTSRRYVLILC